MKIIKLFPKVGSFAENKDAARDIGIKELLPSLEKDGEVVLDFRDIESTTQSFIHALISDIIRQKGTRILDKIYFKNCNKTIEKLINIVVDYMQDNV